MIHTIDLQGGASLILHTFEPAAAATFDYRGIGQSARWCLNREHVVGVEGESVRHSYASAAHRSLRVLSAAVLTDAMAARLAMAQCNEVPLIAGFPAVVLQTTARSKK